MRTRAVSGGDGGQLGGRGTEGVPEDARGRRRPPCGSARAARSRCRNPSPRPPGRPAGRRTPAVARARSTRCRVSRTCGLSPVSSRKRRVKVRTLIDSRAASSAKGSGRSSRRSDQARAAPVEVDAASGTGRSLYGAWPPSRCGETTVTQGPVRTDRALRRGPDGPFRHPAGRRLRAGRHRCGSRSDHRHEARWAARPPLGRSSDWTAARWRRPSRRPSWTAGSSPAAAWSPECGTCRGRGPRRPRVRSGPRPLSRPAAPRGADGPRPHPLKGRSPSRTGAPAA